MDEHETSWTYPVPCLDNERLHRSEVSIECDVRLIVSSVGATWVVPLFGNDCGEKKFAVGYKPFASSEAERRTLI
jgi:hypothetical protein